MATFEQIQEEITNILEIPAEELDPSQQALVDEYLAELGVQEAAKVDSFSRWIREQDALAEHLKEESRRLAARSKAVANGIGRLKSHYLHVMMSNGLKKVSGEAYQISVRKSEAVEAPSDPDALDALDPQFVRRKVTIEPDKAVIKEALKAGAEIPGCSLRENYSLSIR